MLPSRASGVESCTVSSSLPIPACNRQNMQLPPPPNVSSSAAPHVAQVEICRAGGCICYGYAARLGETRPGQRLPDLTLNLFLSLGGHVELSDDRFFH